MFRDAKVAVFVDGDFWHGRKLNERLAKLSRGHNRDYWTKKILSNVARDRRVRRELNAKGWKVVRVWETDIISRLDRVIARILKAVQ